MDKNELQLQKRLIELSKTAYERNIVTYSNFLNLNELHILHGIPKELFYTTYSIFGGHEFSERQMVAFLPDAFCYDLNYPMSTVSIVPLQKRFAEKLTHRDYLGAILNLGIERSKLGDILITKETVLLMIHSSLLHFLITELGRIKHTSVLVKEVNPTNFIYVPDFEEITGSVASVRLDSILALAYSMSRSKLVQLIEGGKVYVNSRLITTNGYKLEKHDIISVRGFGKISYEEPLHMTKKGRLNILIKKYI